MLMSAATAVLSGSTSPYAIPFNAANPSTVKVHGSNFDMIKNDEVYCSWHSGDWPGNQTPGPNALVKVLSDTEIECSLPSPTVEGTGFIRLAYKDGNNYGTGQNDMQIIPFVDATVSHRPFLSDNIEDASILLHVDVDAITAYEDLSSATHLTVCVDLLSDTTDNRYVDYDAEGMLPSDFSLPDLLPCKTIDFTSISTTVLAIPLDLDLSTTRGLPDHITNGLAKIKITIGDNDFPLLPMARLFSIAPSSKITASQTTTVVNHKTRSVSLNDEDWIGFGYYFTSLVEYGTSNITMDNAITGFRTFKRQGLNFIMPYALNTILDEKSDDEITMVLDAFAEYDVMFVCPLLDLIVTMISSPTDSANFTTALTTMKTRMDKVSSHPNLIGWYLCDGEILRAKYIYTVSEL